MGSRLGSLLVRVGVFPSHVDGSLFAVASADSEITMHASAHQQQLARGLGFLGLGLGIAAIAKLTWAHRSGDLAGAKALVVRTSVTIRRDVRDVYAFWRDLSNLPLFMRHVASVSEVDGHASFRACGPVGSELEWDAEIVADRPNERIAWRSLEGARLANHGSVTFRRASQGRGTEVHLELAFEPPLGRLGAKVARLFDAIPEQQLKNDLRRLKQLLETGEIVHSDASIHPFPHPARPPKREQLPLVLGMVRS
jgi:uncharacterized membrane protein